MYILLGIAAHTVQRVTENLAIAGNEISRREDSQGSKVKYAGKCAAAPSLPGRVRAKLTLFQHRPIRSNPSQLNDLPHELVPCRERDGSGGIIIAVAAYAGRP